MEWKCHKRWEIRFVRTPTVILNNSNQTIFLKTLDTFRGGLELLELKKGQTVKTFIPKVAEGVFTIICLFNKTDEYVLYYHSGKKTLRVFR